MCFTVKIQCAYGMFLQFHGFILSGENSKDEKLCTNEEVVFRQLKKLLRLDGVAAGLFKSTRNLQDAVLAKVRSKNLQPYRQACFRLSRGN
jgi:hypothetical protein